MERKSSFFRRHAPFLLVSSTIVAAAIIADLTGHTEYVDKSSGPPGPFNHGATGESLQGGLESGRVLSGFEALSRMPRSEMALNWHDEAPFAQTLYWMYGQKETKDLAIKIAKSLNEGKFMVAVGSYVPSRGDGVVEIDFVVSTWTPTPEGSGEPIQGFGTIMYIKEEEFNALTFSDRAQRIGSQFSLQEIKRREILKRVGGGMDLREAIDSVQGVQGTVLR